MMTFAEYLRIVEKQDLASQIPDKQNKALNRVVGTVLKRDTVVPIQSLSDPNHQKDFTGDVLKQAARGPANAAQEITVKDAVTKLGIKADK